MKDQFGKRKRRFVIPAGMTLLCIATLLNQRADTTPIEDDNTSKTTLNEILQTLNEPEVISLTLPEDTPDSFAVTLTTTSGNHKLVLEHVSFRAAICKLLVDDGSGLVEHPLPKARTYRGKIESCPDSNVAVSLCETGLYGTIDFGGDDGTRFIQPLTSLGLVEPEQTNKTIRHVVYHHSLISPMRLCGTLSPNLDLKANAHAKGTVNEQPPSGGLAGNFLYYDLIALDSDYEFYQLNGESITDTLNDIELILNLTNIVFERDVNLRHVASAFIIRTDPNDPYTSTNASDLSCELSDVWSFSTESNIPFDLTQLFTGKNLDSSIGYAWIGTSCAGHGQICAEWKRADVSVVQSRYTNHLDFRTALTAHEIGHTWGAYHCGGATCKIMCSQINGCGGVSGPNLVFSDASQSMITNTMSFATCLKLIPDPIELPFVDFFDQEELSSALWEYNRGATISTLGNNEASPPSSLMLDSLGSGEYDEDMLRSHKIPLDKTINASVSFWAQVHGYINGEPLNIEYLANTGAWTTLGSISNAGMNEEVFTQYTFDLPPNAYHADFRIGFHADIGGGWIRWFIDNVEISGDPKALNDECRDAPPLTMGTHTFTTLGATDSPISSPMECDPSEFHSDIWYQIDAICDGQLIAHTCGTTDIDTIIAIYDATNGCPNDANANTLACNDDYDCENGSSLVIAEVDNGQSLLLRIGTTAPMSGNGTISLICNPIEEPCPADLDEDGFVGGSDLALLLGGWGGIIGDINEDGVTNGADLSLMLGEWGACSD